MHETRILIIPVICAGLDKQPCDLSSRIMDYSEDKAYHRLQHVRNAMSQMPDVSEQ